MLRILHAGLGVLWSCMVFMGRAGALLCCVKWYVWGAGGPLFGTGEFLSLV